MTRLAAGSGTDAAHIPAAFELFPPEQVVSGSPATRYADLDDGGARVVGVWEHSPGVSIDVEADEVFVVLAGAGILSFDEPALPSVELRPGVIVRLAEGMKTTWDIRETLRKVYVTP